MLLQIFKVEKNYFSIKGLKTKGLKNLAGEESVKESSYDKEVQSIFITNQFQVLLYTLSSRFRTKKW